MKAWVIEPGHGSLWLDNCKWVDTRQGRYVVGDCWDDQGVGSAYLPDDYYGEVVVMNFPEALVLRTEE